MLFASLIGIHWLWSCSRWRQPWTVLSLVVSSCWHILRRAFWHASPVLLAAPFRQWGLAGHRRVVQVSGEPSLSSPGLMMAALLLRRGCTGYGWMGLLLGRWRRPSGNINAYFTRLAHILFGIWSAFARPHHRTSGPTSNRTRRTLFLTWGLSAHILRPCLVLGSRRCCLTPWLCNWRVLQLPHSLWLR